MNAIAKILIFPFFFFSYGILTSEDDLAEMREDLEEIGEDLKSSFPVFMRSIHKAHQNRDLSHIKSDMAHLEFELRLARESDDEDHARHVH